MSYISTLRKGDEVLVWERSDEGRTLQHYRAPHYFYVEDKNGEHETVYGDTVTRITFNTGREYRDVRDDCKIDGIRMFESDITPETRILSSEYYGKPAPKLNVTLLDIEVDYNTDIGFSSIENPYAPINAIAFHHSHTDAYVLYAVPPDDTWTVERLRKDVNNHVPLPEDMEIDIQLFSNEAELLEHMLAEIEDSDILCGWNSDFFDVPYIAKRLEKLGKSFFRRLSFKGAALPKYREIERYNKMHTTIDLSGRVSLDYLELFRKYEMEERPSYKLESIADEIMPELPKLEYEGSLAKLYKNDFAYFIRYNIRDTEILKGFEDKLGYVGLANEMCHLSTGEFKHVGGTLKLAELATINYCHHELGGLVVNDNHIPDEDGQIQGALVLLPQVGQHMWIGSVDINSLYPASIRSINISPETLIGQFADNNKAAAEIAKGSAAMLVFRPDEGPEQEATADEWRDLLKAQKWAVSGYGTVFDQNTPGIIPTILKTWYAKRKDYQKLKAEAIESGNQQDANYYDRLQYVYKIKLNSFYGALTNKYFRFYDLRMGESTTATGRGILQHQCAKTCELLAGEYVGTDIHKIDNKGKEHFGYSDKWPVVYGDTDSTYFTTSATNKEEAIQIADMVGEQINESFQGFMQDTYICSEGYDDIIKCGREVVSSQGIFVDKKRYILHLVNLDGYECDKMKVMGLDTKKTTLPKWVSKILNGYIERYLKGEDWDVISRDIVDLKDSIETTDDIMSIGLPKGVNKVETYTETLRTHGAGIRLPGHVAAAIHYNACLESYNDKESMPIMSGMKIKVFYITEMVGKFKSIALPVDIDEIPAWFEKEYTVNRAMHIERLVDKPLGNIIKAIGKDVPTRQGLLVESLLEF